uniref:Uncharacterized protein n=1 Tax=Cajanus cajan TaxID=3821 RepID=A0A151SN94_CAJCA|nr:hypothetical protein KK1_002457 [Cajanus cajan]
MYEGVTTSVRTPRDEIKDFPIRIRAKTEPINSELELWRQNFETKDFCLCRKRHSIIRIVILARGDDNKMWK